MSKRAHKKDFHEKKLGVTVWQNRNMVIFKAQGVTFWGYVIKANVLEMSCLAKKNYRKLNFFQKIFNIFFKGNDVFDSCAKMA